MHGKQQASAANAAVAATLGQGSKWAKWDKWGGGGGGAAAGGEGAAPGGKKKGAGGKKGAAAAGAAAAAEGGGAPPGEAGAAAERAASLKVRASPSICVVCPPCRWSEGGALPTLQSSLSRVADPLLLRPRAPRPGPCRHRARAATSRPPPRAAPAAAAATTPRRYTCGTWCRHWSATPCTAGAPCCTACSTARRRRSDGVWEPRSVCVWLCNSECKALHHKPFPGMHAVFRRRLPAAFTSSPHSSKDAPLRCPLPPPGSTAKLVAA